MRDPAKVEHHSNSDNDMIKMIIKPRERDLGGFFVRRLLPYAKQRKVGPWVFFDHMGPAEFAAGEGINVAPHPHINLATVTYLFEGEVFHRDSLGNAQAIKPGDINLMVAGRGIVHSERETAQTHQKPHRLHGLQLWLALPVADEETDPAFYHYPHHEIPSVDVDGVSVRILMGNAYNATSPVKTFAKTLYIEATLRHDQQLVLPYTDERALYLAAGKIRIGSDVIHAGQMVILGSENITVHALAESQIALIGGETMETRHMFWNFISTRPERIEQAKSDWQHNRFDVVIGDEDERVPLPEQ